MEIIPKFLKKIAKFGRVYKREELIQIPILIYNSVKNLNSNPYLLIREIDKEYHTHKGHATEIEFWVKKLDEYKKGKIKGFESEAVYELENEYVVETIKSEATTLFWINLEMEELEEDVSEFIDEKLEQEILYIDGEDSHSNIYYIKI